MEEASVRLLVEHFHKFVNNPTIHKYIVVGDEVIFREEIIGVSVELMKFIKNNSDQMMLFENKFKDEYRNYFFKLEVVKHKKFMKPAEYRIYAVVRKIQS